MHMQSVNICISQLHNGPDPVHEDKNKGPALQTSMEEFIRYMQVVMLIPVVITLLGRI